MEIMPDFSSIKIYCTKTNLVILAVLLFLLLYPNDLKIGTMPIVNEFIKNRVLSLAIVFLVLRCIVHDYYSPRLAILFLIMLVLAPSLTFGYLVLITLGGLLLLKLLKKI